PDRSAPLLPVIPLHFERDGHRFSYFSMVTTLGTPIDVTAQELRIECFYPLDDATRRLAHALERGEIPPTAAAARSPSWPLALPPHAPPIPARSRDRFAAVAHVRLGVDARAERDLLRHGLLAQDLERRVDRFGAARGIGERRVEDP